MGRDNFRPFSFSKTYPRQSRKAVVDAVSLHGEAFCQVVSASNALAEQISRPRKGKNPVYPVNPV